MTTKELNARQARWAEELSSYDFVIEHIKGKENTVADALSRRPDYQEAKQVDRTTQIFKETNEGLIMNKNIQLRMVTIEQSDEIDKRIKELTDKDERYPELRKGDDGYKRFQGLILVPKELEQELIARYHDDIREGHPGEARTVEKIQRNYYLPGTIRKVRKFIKACNKCQQNKPVHTKTPGKMHQGITPTLATHYDRLCGQTKRVRHHQQRDHEPNNGGCRQIFETNDTDTEPKELHRKGGISYPLGTYIRVDRIEQYIFFQRNNSD